MKFQFYTKSQVNPEEPVNGDHCASLHLEKEDLMVLVVSDGVSSHDYDWQAVKQNRAMGIKSKSFREIQGDFTTRLLSTTPG